MKMGPSPSLALFPYVQMIKLGSPSVNHNLTYKTRYETLPKSGSMDDDCELLRSPPVQVMDALQAGARGILFPRSHQLA